MRLGFSPRLSFANVVSVVALFVALGGGAYAALSKNSVGAKQIKRNAVRSAEIARDAATGKDIEETSLGQVPSAASAESATTASSVADNAITGPKIADGSVGATDLDSDEPFHEVGASGEPEFGKGGDGDCLWFDIGTTLFGSQRVGFYKDKLGQVHLAGIPAANNGGGGDSVCDDAGAGEQLEDFRAFTLPPGYRPDRPTFLPTTSDGCAKVVVIGGDEDSLLSGATLPAGAVIVSKFSCSTAAYFDGLSFRAAG